MKTMTLQDFIKNHKGDVQKFISEDSDDLQIQEAQIDTIPDNSIEGMDKNTINDSDASYYNMKNPETGLRYDIPLLSSTDPEYYFKYIYYMKLKESSPETFKKLLTWD